MKRILHDIRASVWRHPDVRIVGAAQALTFLAGEVVVVALLLQAFASGWGTAGTAAVLAVAALPVALGSVLAGPLVDRFSSRTLSMTAAAWQSGACALAALSQVLGASEVWLLAGLLLLQLGQAVAGPTWSALLPSLVPRAELPALMGSVSALVMLLSLLGPVVAGVAVAGGGTSAALLVAAGLLGVVALLGARVGVERPGTTTGEGPAPRLSDGLRFLRDEPVLSALVGGFVAFVLAVEVVGVVLVFLVRGDLQAGELTYGVLTSGIALGLVLGSLLAGRAPAGHAMVRVVVTGAAGMAGALVVAGLAPGVVTLGVALVALGVFNGLVNTGAQTTIALRVPLEQRGRVLAAVVGVLRTASVLGLVLGGAVGGLLEPRTVMVGAGALGLLVALWLWRRLWRSPDTDATGSPEARLEAAETAGAAEAHEAQLEAAAPGSAGRS